MATENIQIVATAQDRASPTLNKVKANVQALGSKTKGPLGGLMGGLGGINPLALAAGAGIGFLTVKLGEGFKGMLDEEKQLGRLDTALQNNVTNWDGNYDAINKVVGLGQDLAFTDDAIRESMIKLVPVTKDAGQALSDVQLAMDIARGRGIDLEAATAIVTKAELRQFGALKKLGIELDNTSTSTEALAELQRQYGGQAEKYADSTAGKLESANIKVDESFESLAGGITQAAAEIMKFGEQGPQAMDLIIDQLFGNGAHADALIQEKVDSYAAMIQGHMDSLANVFKEPGAKGAKVYGTAFNDQLKTIKFGEFLTDDLASSLQAGVKDDIKGAMEKVTWAIKHPLALTRQTAQIEGALTTLEYKRGLASNTPEVNAVIDQQIQALRAKWSSLTGQAYQEGVSAANALERGLRTFNAPNFPVFGGKSNKNTDKGHVGTGGRAAGGDVDAYATVRINERGQEFLTAGKRGAHVTPNHLLGGGGGDVYLDGEKVGRILDQRQGRQMALSPSSSYSR